MNAKDVKYHFKKYFGYDMPQTQINVFSPEFIDFCLYIASQQSAPPTPFGSAVNPAAWVIDPKNITPPAKSG